MNFPLQEKNLNLINNIMGQKSNPISLRLALKNTLWPSEYIEKSSRDSSITIYQDLEIRKHLNRFFIIHGLILVNCFINRYQRNIEIIISYFITSNFIKFIKSRGGNNVTHKKSHLIKKRSTRVLKKRKRFMQVVKRKTFFFTNLIKKKKTFKRINFISKLLSSLNLFLNKRHNIKIILQSLNKSLSFRLKNKEAYFFRKLITKLRFYSRSNFFSESINILIIFVRKKSMVKLLPEFISSKLSILKRHNFFLTFIKRSLVLLLNSKYSLVRGLKMRINGRFNGAARSKTRVFQINKIPLQTLDLSIHYHQSVSYTNNGTFGVKLWVYTK